MMANAVERDAERKKNVKRYALEDKKEEKIEKFDGDFARYDICPKNVQQLKSILSNWADNIPNQFCGIDGINFYPEGPFWFRTDISRFYLIFWFTAIFKILQPR